MLWSSVSEECVSGILLYREDFDLNSCIEFLLCANINSCEEKLENKGTELCDIFGSCPMELEA